MKSRRWWDGRVSGVALPPPLHNGIRTYEHPWGPGPGLVVAARQLRCGVSYSIHLTALASMILASQLNIVGYGFGLADVWAINININIPITLTLPLTFPLTY